jgi:hypothetical protein
MMSCVTALGSTEQECYIVPRSDRTYVSVLDVIHNSYLRSCCYAFIISLWSCRLSWAVGWSVYLETSAGLTLHAVRHSDLGVISHGLFKDIQTVAQRTEYSHMTLQNSVDCDWGSNRVPPDYK